MPYGDGERQNGLPEGERGRHWERNWLKTSGSDRNKHFSHVDIFNVGAGAPTLNGTKWSRVGRDSG
jgi:hypothetical protein